MPDGDRLDVYLAVGHGVEPTGVFDPGAIGADISAGRGAVQTAVVISGRLASVSRLAPACWSDAAGRRSAHRWGSRL